MVACCRRTRACAPAFADDLQRVLQERLLLIERGIHPVRLDDQRWNTSTLDEIQLQWCSRLEVGYTLKAFNRNHSLPPEATDTFYSYAEQILYVQRSSDIPWLDIASSLADVMNRDAEEGTVAPGLFVALNAPSLQKGSQALDKLKVPPLQADEEYSITLSTPADMGGIDTLERDGIEHNINMDKDLVVVSSAERQEEQTDDPDEAHTTFNSGNKQQEAQQFNPGDYVPTSSRHQELREMKRRADAT